MKIRKFTIGLRILVLILICEVSLYSKSIYISHLGNDGNTGDRESPLANIQTGLDFARAGDSVIVTEGAYYLRDKLMFRNSGRPGRWITLMALPGDKVTINANAFYQNLPEPAMKHWHHQGSIHVKNVSYIRIVGLTVLYSHTAGIFLEGKGQSNFEIKNCKIVSTYNSGIGLWYADSVTVSGCEIIDANNQDHRPTGAPIKREAPHEALSVAGCANFEIAYNYLHLCMKEGIDVKEFSSNGKVHHNYIHNILRQGLYVDSWFGVLRDVEFYHNIVHDCEWGFMISAEGKGSSMTNIRFHDNLLYANRGNGICISVIGKNEPRDSLYLYRNTICFNGTVGHWSGKTGGISIKSPNVTNTFIYENILYQNQGFEIATFDSTLEKQKFLKEKNIKIEDNLISSFHDSQDSAGFYQIELYPLKGDNPIGDPGFVNPRSHDFRIDSVQKHKKYGADLGQFYQKVKGLNQAD